MIMPSGGGNPFQRSSTRSKVCNRSSMPFVSVKAIDRNDHRLSIGSPYSANT